MIPEILKFKFLCSCQLLSLMRFESIFLLISFLTKFLSKEKHKEGYSSWGLCPALQSAPLMTLLSSYSDFWRLQPRGVTWSLHKFYLFILILPSHSEGPLSRGRFSDPSFPHLFFTALLPNGERTMCTGLACGPSPGQAPAQTLT